MDSRAQPEFEWNDKTRFINIISTLFNNWPEMKLIEDPSSGDSEKTMKDNLKRFIKNFFDCIVIYGTGESATTNLIKGVNGFDDFHIMIVDDSAALEMSTRIYKMYDKWNEEENMTENRKQILEEIKNLPKPYPIVGFEDLPPRLRLTFETDEIMC